MPVTQQQPIFTTEEAERFAALWAGFDTGNASEAEAMTKGRGVRRMLAGKKFDDGAAVRLVDAFELPEIRAALDAQMQPARQPLPDVAALQAEREELLEKNLTLIDALMREQELTARLQGRQNGSFTGPLLSGVLALGLAAECVLALVGLFGGRATPRPEPASVTLPPLEFPASPRKIEPDAEVEQLMGKREPRPHTRPKAKPKPVPVVPESQF